LIFFRNSIRKLRIVIIIVVLLVFYECNKNCMRIIINTFSVGETVWNSSSSRGATWHRSSTWYFTYDYETCRYRSVDFYIYWLVIVHIIRTAVKIISCTRCKKILFVEGPRWWRSTEKNRHEKIQNKYLMIKYNVGITMIHKRTVLANTSVKWGFWVWCALTLSDDDDDDIIVLVS